MRGVALLALTAAAGCAVGPNYHRPRVEAPPSFRFAESATTAASIADLPWWDVFRDDALQALLRRALVEQLRSSESPWPASSRRANRRAPRGRTFSRASA